VLNRAGIGDELRRKKRIPTSNCVGCSATRGWAREGSGEEVRGKRRGAYLRRFGLGEKRRKGDMHRRFPGEEGGGWR
jgi:hypothetical protein